MASGPPQERRGTPDENEPAYRTRSGQTMVEFTIVLPILLVVMFGIFQFGITFKDYVALTDAVRAGARTAAVSRYAVTPSQTRRRA